MRVESKALLLQLFEALLLRMRVEGKEEVYSKGVEMGLMTVGEVGRAKVSHAAPPLSSHAGSGHTKSSPEVRLAGVMVAAVADEFPLVDLKAQENGEGEREEREEAINPARVLITVVGVSPRSVTLATFPVEEGEEEKTEEGT